MLTSHRQHPAIGFLRSILPTLFLLAILFGACQQPNEPDNILISDVVVAVKVVDQGGRGISGVEVRYAPEPRATTLAPLGTGVTGEDGTVSQIFSIPSTGSTFTFEVSGLDGIPGSGLRRFDSVLVPCSDFVLEIEVPREQTIACGQRLPAEDLAIALCIDTKPGDTICTPFLNPLCPRPMVITAAPALSSIPGATLLMRLNGVPAAGNSVTLADTNDRCEVCMIYRAQQGNSSGSQRVAVTGAPSGQAPYTLLNVDFAAESKCDSCSCPPALTVNHPAVNADTICVGEPYEVNINLARMVNSNETCDLVFTLDRPPVNPSFRIRSFNGGDNALSPGSSLLPLRLTVTPTVPGPINESLVYTVKTRGRDGQLSDCAKLTINVKIQAVAPACPLQLSGTLIDPSGPGRTNPLSQGVCDSSTGSAKTVCITNPSTTCAFIINRVRLSGGDVSQFELDPDDGFPIEIPPGGTECFEISFQPTRDYYLASGNPPRSRFTTNLTISTACGDSVLPIVGNIPEPKIPPMRIFPIDCARNPNTGIMVQGDGSIVTDQIAGGNFLISVQSITIVPGNPAANSAMLDIRTPFQLLRSNFTDATPLCDLRFDPAARNACGSLGGAGLQRVVAGEVYVFNYSFQGCSFCALLWIESIDDISVTRSCPQVQLRICSPLVF